MARKDIRTSGEAIPLTHHSARGNVQRKAGNFTRGSQLITHEMMMWFSGATLPFILWFFAFAAAWFIIMSIQLDEHGQSEERRVGQVLSRPFKSRWYLFHLKK